ncbi:hypothetical protein D9615_000313 [Tricholomella constricta]|uniref:Uncharacterized protein n=1 Tax=Tricholomella constricta TaxID=117010 RepID=A0A8H5HQZ3_9AGAR|nr:hypothetical protein D9615_000313 [Tricholomella constricta]
MLTLSLPNYHLPRDLIPPRTFSNFTRYDMSLLSHFGAWALDPDTHVPSSFLPNVLPPSAPRTLHRDWPLFLTWFHALPLLLLLLARSDPLLLTSRPQRQSLAENVIHTLFRLQSPSPNTVPPSSPSLASDASLVPCSPSLQPSVIFAVTLGGRTLTATLANFRSSASILRGEAYGIAAALVLSMADIQCPQTLYSDHLTSVNLINSSTHPPVCSPAQSIYRRIRDLLSRRPPTAALSLQHVRAHTSSTSPAALLNRVADHAASSSQRLLQPPPPAPIPTFFMDDYMPFSSADGWVEANLTDYVQSKVFSLRSRRLPSTSLFSLVPYDYRPPPDYPYLQAPSFFSAVVQLYLRANQLDTAARLSSRLHVGEQPYCRFGCLTYEDARHIFVHCPRFDALRREMDETTAQATVTFLDVFRVPPHFQGHIIQHAQHLSHDSASWPFGHTMYFYGVFLPLDDITRSLTNTSFPNRQLNTLRLRISATWHTACIRLAGRIWGIAKCSHRESTLPAVPTTHRSVATLPSHLSSSIVLSKQNKLSLRFT